MKTQQTPVPWVREGIEIRAANGKRLFRIVKSELSIDGPTKMANQKYAIIAVNSYDEDQKKIAALLEAAKEASEILADYPNDERDTEFEMTRKRLAKAISQAMGETK